MQPEKILELLNSVKDGGTSVENALERLKTLPYDDLGYAKIDNHRQLRRGFPEVIFCQGKEALHVKGIVQRMLEGGSETVLGTRASVEQYNAVLEIAPDAEFIETAKIIKIQRDKRQIGKGIIAVVTGGTTDIPVAEEAAITAEVCGNKVERIYDVGVAGLHRLLDKLEDIRRANVVIAVAGMEGALPSVLSGLIDRPVIAVPTSVGYGASLGGFSALLSMLNSCSSGVSVVNIDNGFGAGYIGAMINRGHDYQ